MIERKGGSEVIVERQDKVLSERGRIHAAWAMPNPMPPKETAIMLRRIVARQIAAIAALAIPLWGFASLAAPCIVSAQEQPVAPEANPPGDIPDSQVFIAYASPLGFSLQVPEGWARSDRADGARFADKYDTVDVSSRAASSAPTVASVRANEAEALARTGHAVKITGIKSMKLPAGSVVLIVYTSNSEPNAVTGKQIRLENNRYLFFKAGRIVTLDLAAPMGADNVDQWKLMSESFRWN
jgi:hypothetical protein